jgi:PadR family transcriptional regulator PadR
MGRNFLGEFEQRVLLAILRCDVKAYPIDIRKEIARASGHDPSRGAFYTTLDRLEAKQLVRWTAEGGEAGRDGLPQRRFTVTHEGVAALRASRRALLELWNGLEEILES